MSILDMINFVDAAGKNATIQISLTFLITHTEY